MNSLMKRLFTILLIVFAFSTFISCKNTPAASEDTAPVAPVKVTSVKQGDISNYINLNGKITYLKKNKIVAPISGYIIKIYKNFGDRVFKNEVLFELQSKEGKALENAHVFEGKPGIIKVRATSNGFISNLVVNQTGGYVVEGDLLGNIVDNADLMVLVNVPFEYNSLLKIGTKATLLFSDKSVETGTVYRILPVINETDQTQDTYIKLTKFVPLPENLNLSVRFNTNTHEKTLIVPKSAVLTNETQTEYWVLKIVNDTLAVKAPFEKGLENDSLVEIKSSAIKLNDKIVIDGGYGLQDSTSVKIIK